MLSLGLSVVCAGSRHAIVSTNRQKAVFAISGVRIQSYPLPFDRRFSPLYGAYFGSKQCFRQRLSRHLPVSPLLRLGLSWLSFSRSRFSRDARTWSRSGFDCRQSEGSPHRHTFSEPAFASRPEARGRICSRNGHAPTLKHDGLDESNQRTIKVFPYRPHSRSNKTLSDRTLRLFFWKTKPEGLLQRASVEHGQARLHASGSTGTAH